MISSPRSNTYQCIDLESALLGAKHRGFLWFFGFPKTFLKHWVRSLGGHINVVFSDLGKDGLPLLTYLKNIIWLLAKQSLESWFEPTVINFRINTAPL